MEKKIVLIYIFVILGSIFLIGCTNSPNDSNKNFNPPPEQTDTEIFIPVNDLSTSAKFYSYESDEGVTIRYFSVMDSSGKVHVAFDACNVCYEAKKGYRQNGEVMQCINCEKEFSITSIGTDNTAGGCWPSYLPMTINENKVVIKIADLLEKKYLFE